VDNSILKDDAAFWISYVCVTLLAPILILMIVSDKLASFFFLTSFFGLSMPLFSYFMNSHERNYIFCVIICSLKLPIVCRQASCFPRWLGRIYSSYHWTFT